MATKKPKTKRMALGGMAAGVASNVLKPSAPKPQSRFASASAKQTPNYAKPYVARQTPDYARPYTSAQKPPSSGQMPSQLASVARAYNAQKPAMKKGGTVKKKAVKK
jgi:hypothetical protein